MYNKKIWGQCYEFGGRHMKSEEKQPEKQDQKMIFIMKELFSWVAVIGLAILFSLFLNRVIFINAEVPTGSMENTIMPGDKLIGSRLAYRSANPKRGDIIIFHYPDDETQIYVKRVIGLPGEKIIIDDATIYIDDMPLVEGYLKEEWTVSTGYFEFEVPEDSYLVLGDNRNSSWDARFWANSYVEKDKILGKAWCRYWPLNQMKKLQ
ncbi:MAG: signal peptidase I [Lachnospiraceae bacterium]|nr:signal peptidase I [Lachnospiraceae bacterium]